jgi:hypothetical protein
MVTICLGAGQTTLASLIHVEIRRFLLRHNLIGAKVELPPKEEVMSNLRRLEYRYEVAKNPKCGSDCKLYYEETFTAQNFNRPPAIGKVDVWIRKAAYDDTVPPPDTLLKQFQQFLDDIKQLEPDIEALAERTPGWSVPFLDGRFDVFFFSTKRVPPKEEWIEVKS